MFGETKCGDPHVLLETGRELLPTKQHILIITHTKSSRLDFSGGCINSHYLVRRVLFETALSQNDDSFLTHDGRHSRLALMKSVLDRTKYLIDSFLRQLIGFL